MLVILDRDGVINFDSDDYIKSPDEWLPIPGSLEAIGKLSQAGHKVAVATNQSGIGRCYYSEETLQAIHQKMQSAVAAHGGKIDYIAYCPHLPDDGCECRKPKPGLLLQIAKALQIDLANAILVGDSLRDIQAGLAAGCTSWLVKSGNGQKTLAADHPILANIPIFPDLSTIAEYL